MIIDAGEPGRDVRLDARDDGWIAGEFVSPAAGVLDETAHRYPDLPSVAWLAFSGYEADH